MVRIKNDESCIENDKICVENDEIRIKHDESCIENDELCIETDGFSADAPVLKTSIRQGGESNYILKVKNSHQKR